MNLSVAKQSRHGSSHVMEAIDVIADIRQRVAALGAVFDGEVLTATRAIYRPLLDLRSSGLEQIDQIYGPHQRHRLDIYRPTGESHGTVVYVHGGGFVAGDKNADGAFYRNVGCWLARQGFTAVLPNYRLAPSNPWPAATQDLQLVLQWLQQDRQARSDDAPLLLWGQSAGACHVASWLFDDVARGAAHAVQIDGALLMSGFYQANAPLPDGPKAYFGDDALRYAQRSPITHVSTKSSVPVWLAVAEFDPGWIAAQTYELALALTRANDQSPTMVFFLGHNHVSTVQSLGSPQQDVGKEVLRFFTNSPRRKAS